MVHLAAADARFGISDGDHQMLQWTAAGSGAGFAGIVHDTDAEREYANQPAVAHGSSTSARPRGSEGFKNGWEASRQQQVGGRDETELSLKRGESPAGLVAAVIFGAGLSLGCASFSQAGPGAVLRCSMLSLLSLLFRCRHSNAPISFQLGIGDLLHGQS
jgi:hypothetical protein